MRLHRARRALRGVRGLAVAEPADGPRGTSLPYAASCATGVNGGRGMTTRTTFEDRLLAELHREIDRRASGMSDPTATPAPDRAAVHGRERAEARDVARAARPSRARGC
ncbi:hypothetical protein SGLAM104S_01165 [Streptomyces glaucescens]